MQFSRIAIMAALIAASPISFAQPAQAQTAQDKFEVSFQARETQRRAKIATAMRFDDEQAAKFWPIYDQYRLVAKGQQLQRYRLLQKLATNAIDINAMTATDIISSALALESEQQSAKQKFLSNVAPHFRGTKYFRIFQLETKLDAIFRYGWTRAIPLALTAEELNMLQGAAEAKARAEKLSSQPTT